jgi:4'-phosphopantetheinyl transferase
VIFSRVRRFCQIRTLALVHLVEVWQIDLAPDTETARRLTATLDAAERARAARLRSPGHAERWMVSRGALRTLLGERLGVAPAAVALAAGPHGKPEVPGAPVRFNVSHAGELALVALAAGCEVGVDVERLDRSSRAVERTLTEAERAALPEAGRHEALLRVWCRKEALAKAGGGGLGWAPEAFDTTTFEGYALRDVSVPSGYVAALAVAGHPVEVALRRMV